MDVVISCGEKKKTNHLSRLNRSTHATDQVEKNVFAAGRGRKAARLC